MFSGGAPEGGYGDGWILLSKTWVTTYYDANHAEVVRGRKRTLQSELVHEADHLMEHTMPSNMAKHSDNKHTPDRAATANSFRCGEFGSGG